MFQIIGCSSKVPLLSNDGTTARDAMLFVPWWVTFRVYCLYIQFFRIFSLLESNDQDFRFLCFLLFRLDFLSWSLLVRNVTAAARLVQRHRIGIALLFPKHLPSIASLDCFSQNPFQTVAAAALVSSYFLAFLTYFGTLFNVMSSSFFCIIFDEFLALHSTMSTLNTILLYLRIT